MSNKKNYLVFLLLFTFSSLFARTIEGEEAERLLPGTSLISFNDESDLINHIQFNTSKPLMIKDFDSWLQKFNQRFLPSTELKLLKKEQDKAGFTHISYTQYYHNHPIEYAVLKVHFNKNEVAYLLNAEIYESKEENDFSAVDKVNVEKAKEIAKTYFINQQINDPSTEVELSQQLFFPLKNQLIPCFKIDIYAHSPEPKRAYLYISAKDGTILFEENRIEFTNVTGTAVTKYSGTKQITTDSINAGTYYLRENGARSIHTQDLNGVANYANAVEFVDNDNYWNTTTNQDDAANDAHFGAEKTYDYYYNIHGRNSYDGAGATINNYVHYSVNYVNAFWDGTQMSYGDGDATTYGPLTALDVVGHEITHAVTEHTAALVYNYESGALNESFSDIFGVTIDYYANPTTANFLIGDQCNLVGQAFRNMADPNMYNQPDTYLGSYWYIGAADNGGVHTNSGVQNYWYYLICNGGSGTNDLGNAYNVTGIGMTAAAAITYRTLSVYLTANSQYADARTYSIQSAIDLYGSCSNEVIQVTNAWYAVGVGSLFSNAVFANFIANTQTICGANTPINFTDLSINASAYTWDFGDNSTSNAASPSHTYTSAGVYTVSLIVTGIALCSSGTASDTLIYPNYITIANTPIASLPSCVPISAASATNSYGITLVKLNTINHTSIGASEGYKDFSCTQATTLIVGTQYIFEVKTSSASSYIKAWLDYNNDGIFTNNEQTGSFSTGSVNHQTLLAIPTTGIVLNTGLRLRVLADNSPITSPCQNPNLGQAEDYAVTIENATLPPIANFNMSVTSIQVGQTVNFTDLSANGPSAWAWTINGGNPATSTLQNPTATFSAPGTYTIQLIASNSFGSDTISKTIQVTNNIYLCTVGNIQQTSLLSGNIYDSGGPTGVYQNNEHCSLLIAPGACVDSIILNIKYFQSQSPYDHLSIYDGTSTLGILLLDLSFNQSNYTFSIPIVVKAKSGNMFLKWDTNGSTTYAGFFANWIAYPHPLTPPVANFSVNPNSPAFLDTLHFQNQSTNTATIWHWNFGDGDTSILQNPTHVYAASGTYQVSLISSNCYGIYDTFTQSITVQAPPVVNYSPNSFSVNLACGEVVTVSFYIQNVAGGTLNWSAASPIIQLGQNINISPSYGNMGAGSIDTANIQISVNQLTGGLYTFYLVLQTNTQPNAIDSIPIYVNVSTMPCVDFQYNLTNLCQGKVSFFSQVTNSPTNYLWKFGDGTTSTIPSPIHDYVSLANYNVTLIVTNSTGTDSITKPVSMPTYTGSTNSPCMPLNYATHKEITHVQFHTLNDTTTHPSLSLPPGFYALAYYDDRFCTSGTTLNLNTQYLFKLNLSPSLYAKAWIDYDNDGIFTTTELIADLSLSNNGLSLSNNGAYETLYQTPQNGIVLNYPLRLRIIASVSYFASPCPSSTTFSNMDGLMRDYYVIFTSPQTAPVANFAMSDTIVSEGQDITFNDLSINSPTSWQWTINGGIPTTTTIKNPTINFPTAGTYTIQLVASNSYGSDTFSRVVYISDAVYLCTGNGTSQITTALNGIIYDSGGPTGLYQQYEDCSLLISPGGCTDSIRLIVSAINIGYSSSLKIYNGTPSNATLLYTISQANLFPVSIKANSGNMYLKWTSNSSTGQGFIAHWQAYQHTATAPTANFTFTPLNNLPLQDTVYFQDLSTNNAESWFWEFGDGYYSTLQNPKHVYNLSGIHQVSLIATFCGSSDTLTQSINIQASPTLLLSPTSYSVNLSCDDTVVVPLYIHNTGGGTLNWQLDDDIAGGAHPHILHWPSTLNYPYSEYLLKAANKYIPQFTYETLGIYNPDSLRKKLLGKTTLVMNDISSSNLAPNLPLIHNFVQNGGTVIIPNQILNNNLWKNMDLFTGGTALNLGDSVFIVNTSTPITHQIKEDTVYVQNVNAATITNPNKMTLLSANDGTTNYDVVTLLPFGEGRAIYWGHWVYSSGTYNPNDADRMLANAFKWSAKRLDIGTTSGTLSSGGIDTVYLQLNSSNINGGTNTFSVMLHTNDLNHPTTLIPIYVEVTKKPCIDFISANFLACDAEVHFTNIIRNGYTSLLWDFGDGTTSTAPDPTHVYTTLGNFNVSLTANNFYGSNTYTKNIVISNLIFPPITTTCVPTAGATVIGGYGITNVEVNTINNSSLDAPEAYEDFTCPQVTELYMGAQYVLKITGSVYTKNAKGWIDYNNDGIFSGSEQLFSVNNFQYQKQYPLLIPTSNVILNTSLRLRLISDYSPISSPCLTSTYGQIEDYTVIIKDPAVEISESLEVDSDIQIYPNPFQDEFIVAFPQSEALCDFDLRISNVLGQIVYQKSYASSDIVNHKMTVPAQFSTGIYNLEINMKDSYFVKKIIKE